MESLNKSKRWLFERLIISVKIDQEKREHKQIPLRPKGHNYRPNSDNKMRIL